jgi:hypothetical protein
MSPYVKSVFTITEKEGERMIAVVQQKGLQLTIGPGFSFDREQGVFKGQVAYGDEVLTVCVTKAWMLRAVEIAFATDTDLETVFDPASWIPQAESLSGESHPTVYFEDSEDSNE